MPSKEELMKFQLLQRQTVALESIAASLARLVGDLPEEDAPGTSPLWREARDIEEPHL